VSLVPDEARRRNDEREAVEDAQEARHFWVSLQPRDQTAGQSGPRVRQLLLQGSLLHQAGLISGDAVLNNVCTIKHSIFKEKVPFYRYGTGTQFKGMVPGLNLKVRYRDSIYRYGTGAHFIGTIPGLDL
jgi:hypothetical protein